MAENDSAQEKTEEPTQKRLDKAKEDGQVPRSKELTTSAVLLAGTFGLLMFGGFMAAKLQEIFLYNFSLSREAIFDTEQMFSHLGRSMGDALISMLPLFGVLLIAAITGPIALGGWLFSTKSLAPKFNRLDPISGLKRMFSVKSLVELAKAIGKVGVVLAMAYVMLMVTKEELLGLSSEGVEAGVYHSLQLSLWAAIILSASTIVIVLIDVPFQIWENTKKLRMSKQDIKDEMKDSEGKPEVKGKIRQLQMEMSQRRMMENVPEADVVITNPTHFSVALKYQPDEMETPVVVAKGIDHLALKIREVARASGVEFVEAPPLARAIYHTTEIDEEIPEGLYLSVAQVLAYVFQLREFRKGHGEAPTKPRNFDIPKGMRH